MYSIIFCYRNREEHLRKTIPYVKSHLANQEIDHEIIVIEQNDDTPFRRASTLNIGAQVSNGNIITFSDIDYLPSDNVKYYDGHDDVYLPVKQVEFLTNDMSRRPIEDIPSGYRNFWRQVDDNFFGGVITFRREAFFMINGFNPLYKIWGKEEEDLRNRIAEYKLTVSRGNGLFYALEHPNSEPAFDNPLYQDNMKIYANWKNYMRYGVKTEICVKEEVTPLIPEVDRWIKVKNFDIITDLKEKK